MIKLDKEIRDIKVKLGIIARQIGVIWSGGGGVNIHASTHESGGTDPLDGTSGIEAIKLVAGNRFYFKNSSGTNIASIDEIGDLRIKGEIYVNQSSV